MRVRATVARLNSLCKDMSVGSELQQTLRQRVKRTKRLTKETNVKAEPISTPPQPLSLSFPLVSPSLCSYIHTHTYKNTPPQTHILLHSHLPAPLISPFYNFHLSICHFDSADILNPALSKRSRRAGAFHYTE